MNIPTILTTTLTTCGHTHVFLTTDVERFLTHVTLTNDEDGTCMYMYNIFITDLPCLWLTGCQVSHLDVHLRNPLFPNFSNVSSSDGDIKLNGDLLFIFSFDVRSHSRPFYCNNIFARKIKRNYFWRKFLVNICHIPAAWKHKNSSLKWFETEIEIESMLPFHFTLAGTLKRFNFIQTQRLWRKYKITVKFINRRRALPCCLKYQL